MDMPHRIVSIFCAVLAAAAGVSAQRVWTITGRDVPELAAVDEMVRSQMVGHDIRGASVAIVKDGRLVHARGYTWDHPGVEPIQPTTLFRTASIGKSITSIAIHQLIEDGLLSYDTQVANTLALEPAPGHWADPMLDLVTVDHLLTHTVGWDSDLPGGIDPIVYQDETVAGWLGVGSPPTRHEIATFMAGWPLQFAPGSRWGYCNVGYLLLGMLAEHVTGVDFPEYVFTNIFRRVGVDRARMARTLLSELAPTETTYDGVEGDAYGLTAENAFAAGGMVMAAADLARVYSTLFDDPGSGDLLDSATIQNMLSLPFQAGESIGYGRGWFHEDFFLNSGHTVGWLTRADDGLEVFGHGGGGGGAHTLAVWRSDGIVFVWFTNKDPALPTIDFPVIETWPDHDLWDSVGISTDSVGSAPVESWIQAVVHGNGLEDSRWRSDIGLLNRSSRPNLVRLRYFDRDQTVDHRLELAPHEMHTVEDIVGSMDREGFGPLQITSSNALTVSSRTANISGERTFGQSFPAVTATGGLESGESAVLMQLREDATARTNIGINNQWRRTARIEIALFDADGTLISGHTREVPGQSTVQLDRVFFTLAGRQDVSSGYATVTVLSGQDVYVYGSVIDNATGDPMSIPMKKGPGHRRQLIAAAAHNPGAEGSVWRTDLCLLNPSDVDAAVTVDLYGPGRGHASISVSMPAHQQIQLHDVVGRLDHIGPGGLDIRSEVPILASSRTFTEGPGGTFGLFLDGIAWERAVATGSHVWLPMLRQDSAFRSNIGLFNAGDQPAEITIDLYDETGRRVVTIRRVVGGRDWLQLQEPFSLAAGRENIKNGWARLRIESGRGLVAYAAVIDNITNDGITISMKE